MLQFPELSKFRVTLTPFSPYENDATWTIFWGQTLEPLSENYERLFPLGKTSLCLSLIVSFSLCLSLSLSFSAGKFMLSSSLDPREEISWSGLNIKSAVRGTSPTARTAAKRTIINLRKCQTQQSLPRNRRIAVRIQHNKAQKCKRQQHVATRNLLIKWIRPRGFSL